MLAVINIGGATILAFFVIAVVVLALAAYLLTIVMILKSVSFTLGTVIIGVRAIANQTAPVEEVVRDIATNVNSIQNALRGVLGLAPVGRLGGPRGSQLPAPGTPRRRGGTGVVSMRRG